MRMKNGLRIIVALAFSLALSGLRAQTGAASGPPKSSLGASDASGDTTAQAPPMALQDRNPRYRVMRDDVLVLTFPLSPEFTQTVTIQPDGYVTLLGAGSLHIQGMTVPEVIEALKRGYAKILRDPIIDVDLKDFQKPFFIASGQVAKPGQYDLRYEMTVSEGIAVAGGFTPDGKKQVLLFHRVSSDWVEVRKLQLSDVLHGKHVSEDVQLQPGDMIFVPATSFSTFKKYIPYSTGIYMNPSSSIF